jgi:hypothetical protein
MPKGLWIWPSDFKAQRIALRKVAASPHLMAALTAIGKSRDGMSDAELDDAISDNSEWTTLWVIRQLTALGFVEFKVDLFGNPAKYQLTDAGRNALATITGQPPSPKPPAVAPLRPQPAQPTPPSSQPAVPKAV